MFTAYEHLVMELAREKIKRERTCSSDVHSCIVVLSHKVSLRPCPMSREHQQTPVIVTAHARSCPSTYAIFLPERRANLVLPKRGVVESGKNQLRGHSMAWWRVTQGLRKASLETACTQTFNCRPDQVHKTQVNRRSCKSEFMCSSSNAVEEICLRIGYVSWKCVTVKFILL